MRTRPSSTSTKLACSRVRDAKDWARDGRPALRRWGKPPALSSAGDIPRPWRREKQQRRGRAGRPGRVRAQLWWPYWARTPAADVPGGRGGCALSRGGPTGRAHRLQKALQCQRRCSATRQLHRSLPLAGVPRLEHPLLSAAPRARPKAQPTCRFRQTNGSLHRCTPLSKDPILPGAGVDSPADETPTPGKVAAPCPCS